MLIDKNPEIKSVVNKIDDVGAESVFRTFPMEVLAGDSDMNVEVVSQAITFRFNFSKVYWNTKLGHEHERLVRTFKEGEALCDVMAGVGPFALPAAKAKKLVVFANDLNPDCYESLKDNANKNKVYYLLMHVNASNLID